MSAGKKLVYGVPVAPSAPEEVGNITSGKDNILFTAFMGKDFQGEVFNPHIAFYRGSDAITLSNYNGLPIGSVIFDFQAFKTHYKTAATTWKSSAAAS